MKCQALKRIIPKTFGKPDTTRQVFDLAANTPPTPFANPHLFFVPPLLSVPKHSGISHNLVFGRCWNKAPDNALK